MNIKILTENLLINEEMYAKADKIYTELAKYLQEKLSVYEPDIFIQGSFKLRTVIKPVKGDEYDLDFVCCLTKNYSQLSPKQLKQIVGNVLKQNYAKHIEEKNRCWQLSDGNFHVDIIPAIPSTTDQAIDISDKEQNQYQLSDPKGYIQWFENSCKLRLDNLVMDSIESIPSYDKSFSVLQKAVMILKKHRDLYFNDNNDMKPISIIITTLAGLLYEGEEKVEDAIVNILEKMSDTQYQNTISNPANREENFADKWADEPKKKQAFIEWIQAAKIDFIDYFNSIITTNLPEMPHKLPVKWDMATDIKTFSISANKSVSNAGNHNKSQPYFSGSSLDKGVGLYFKPLSIKSIDYDEIQWQITNTGEEAKNKDQLRGDFYYSNDNDVTRYETTGFSGIHTVECFLIRKNICVAKSKVFCVKVK